MMSKFIGILNIEWSVFPPGNRVTEIPEDATANTIFLLLLTFAKIKLIKNVFPVPPGINKKSPFVENTQRATSKNNH